jgi:hypothetical protein
LSYLELMKDIAVPVSVLADIVADPVLGDSPALVMRQLRHWTTLGLLVPIEGTFTGIGNHRRYGAEAARRAAILTRFAAIGLDVGALNGMVGGLDCQIAGGEAGDLWRAAVEGTRDVYFGVRFAGQPLTEAVIFIVPCEEYERRAITSWPVGTGAGTPMSIIGQVRPTVVPIIWLSLSDLFRGVAARLREHA